VHIVKAAALDRGAVPDGVVITTALQRWSLSGLRILYGSTLIHRHLGLTRGHLESWTGHFKAKNCGFVLPQGSRVRKSDGLMAEDGHGPASGRCIPGRGRSGSGSAVCASSSRSPMIAAGSGAVIEKEQKGIHMTGLKAASSSCSAGRSPE
jgi:hypothetical protein